MTALSRYLFSVLREGDALYRGSVDSLEPILLVAPVGEYSAHESRPMAGMTLGLEDPGGEAATQCLRKERVAGIPGPLAARSSMSPRSAWIIAFPLPKPFNADPSVRIFPSPERVVCR